jgi:hypothetical protein
VDAFAGALLHPLMLTRINGHNYQASGIRPASLSV